MLLVGLIDSPLLLREEEEDSNRKEKRKYVPIARNGNHGSHFMWV